MDERLNSTWDNYNPKDGTIIIVDINNWVNNKNQKDMTIDQNKQVVIKFNKEFFEYANTGITKELLAPTFVNHTAPPNAPTDASVMIQFVTGFHKGFSNVSIQIEEVIGEGEKSIAAKNNQGHAHWRIYG